MAKKNDPKQIENISSRKKGTESKKSFRQMLSNFWNKVSYSIPGTTSFKKKSWRILFKRSHSNYSRFKKIETIDQKTKELLKRRVRRSIIACINHDIKYDMDEFSSILSFVLFVFGLLAGPLLSEFFIRMDFSVIGWIQIFFIYIFVFFICFFILFLPVFLPKLIQEIIPSRMSLTWVISMTVIFGSIFLLLYKFYATKDILTFSLISGLAGTLALVISLLIISFSTLYLVNKLGERDEFRIFNSVIIFNLVGIMCEAEANKKYWPSATFRRRTLSRLEVIANIFENVLPKRLETNDKTTNFWFKKIAIEIGTGFRMRKQWLLIPKEDTRQQFINSIGRDLILAVNGHWDSFERSAPMRLSVEELGEIQIKPILGTVFSGLFPLGLMLGLKYFGLQINNIISDYLVVIAIIWAAISILFLLDPLYKDKIDALKNITSIIFRDKSEK